ncbi:PAS domain-containing protein [Roseateles sp.]|uniref:sensor histidine kinase n=1 Tax=Roseateles sp. TaxID=1971397 RepID=UPI0039ED98E9
MTPAARLAWRFALLPALAVATLTVVMLACGHRLLGEELTRRALASHQQRADLLALQLQMSLRDAVVQVRQLARSPLMQPGAPSARMQAELDHVVERSPRFVWAGLAGPGGQALAASHGRLEGRSAAPAPPARPSGGVHEYIAIGEPVRNETGDVVGVVAAHLGLHWVREQLELNLGSPEQARDAGLQGLVLSGSRGVVPGMVVPEGMPDDNGPPRVWQAGDGQRWLLARSALQGLSRDTALPPWEAVVLQSEEAALAPLHALSLSMLVLGSGAALLLAGVGAWASRRLLMPWDPVFGAVLDRHDGDQASLAARVQALVAQRVQPTPAERLLGWLAQDAGDLRRAIDHLPVAIALADRHYRCEYVNRAYTRLLGWTTESTRGGLVGEALVGEALVGPAGREGLAQLHRQLGDRPGEFVQRLQAQTPGGETVAVQCHLVPMFDVQGRRVGALSVVYDIRPEHSARAHAHAMADRLRALADAALDTLLATLDADGRVLEWSRGAEALTGHPPELALGQTLDALLPGVEPAAGLRCARVKGSCELALQARTGGRQRRFEGSVYRLGTAQDTTQFGLILRDVSERAAQAQVIETARDELTQLNRRLLEQEKQTSRKLAQALHDELGQTLAALRLHWEAWRGAGTEQRVRMDERITTLVALANRQVRGVLAELRPPLLDELGLVAAIDNEIRQHHGTDDEARVELQASQPAQLQRWPADVEYAVFMIAREALLNALRHAGARTIVVRLDGDGRHLALGVSDDGRGLAPEARAGRPGHLGLVGMRERALAIDAHLHIDASPGHGTIVELTWEDLHDDESHLPDR